MALQPSLTHCHVCLAPLRWQANGEPVRCHCGLEATIFIYPALQRSFSTEAGEPIQTVGESACFAHPEKRAVAACQKCGRFVCGLCRIEWGDALLCPACVSAAERRTDLLVRSRMLYDTMALGIALLSVILLYLSLFTAPLAIWLGIKALRSPGSIVPRTKFRAWAAIVLASCEVVGWTWLIVYFVLKAGSRVA